MLSNSYQTPVPRVTSLRMRNDAGKPPLYARILWPALGFPAVISPRERLSDSQMRDTDATRCICVLLLSNRQYLSKEEAARYLRYIQWDKRGRRHIENGKAGSFQEVDIAVRNDLPFPKTPQPESLKLTIPGWKDNYGTKGASGTGIAFGGNRDGENGIVVKLSDMVRNFYANCGLKYLHEIRVSERISGQLSDGQYQLFWNNDNPSENAPSSELKLLIDRFALPRRKTLGDFWNRNSRFLLSEYEYEYGSLHKPYKQPNTPQIRSEILHPLFVQRSVSNNLKIAHLTDLHVDVRENVYEENLKKLKQENPPVNVIFNNWNLNFQKGYKQATNDSDILLLTGDLIDYGRGHFGLNAANQLGNNAFYQTDRNWFLFYYLLASGNAYQKPVYTILGNHDWRVNPYPPFAPGAPDFNTLFHDHTRHSNRNERYKIIQTAHGAGYEKTFSYQIDASGKPGLVWQAIKSGVTNTPFWSRLPLDTTIDSVIWYLLSINPFFDYSCSLPGGQKILMLDWAEKEDLFFSAIHDGKAWAAPPWNDEARLPGPKAKNALTGLQKKMVNSFVESRGTAKIIGVHAPPIAPYSDWSDEEVLSGKKFYDKGTFARGPKMYKLRKPDGSTVYGHPIYAMLPFPDHEHYGTVADFNSFEKEREWFLKRITDPKSGVRVVLSGHIHRNGLYFLHTYSKNENVDSILAGKTVVDGRLFPPGGQVRGIGLTNFKNKFPLFLNTTSLGPRGNFYTRKLTDTERKIGGVSIDPGYAKIELLNNGSVNRIEFQSIGVVTPSATPTPADNTTLNLQSNPVLQPEFGYR